MEHDKSRNFERHPRLPVEVATGEVGASEPETTREIDWRNSSDRKWLTSHTHWAILNGRSVMVSPKS